MPAREATLQSFRIQRWITLVGVVLLLLKFAAYYLTHSVAILTDALESIVNVVAGGISLYSLYVAAKPRDKDHPYGHGKAEFLSAGVEGTLIAVAGVWIMYEAIQKLLHPSPVHQLDFGIVLIAISGVVNYFAGMIAENTGRKNNSLAIVATGKHLKSDAYSTAGLVAGLLLLMFTQWQWVDSAVALLFGLLIIFTGIGIVRKSVAGIMDEADTDLLQQMVTLLNKERQPNWIDLHNLRIIKYGNQMHVDCHLTIPWYLNVHEAHAEVDLLTNAVRHEFGSSLEIFTHTDGCLPFSCRICQVQECPHRKQHFVRSIPWTLHNLFENKKHRIEHEA
ncbi:MAG: cation diffusion facilitator family transporter [Bacteroidetes bacterium]|uniref:cation diffusion facilitator family transporter n=1 Tax=Phnomibacter sp. TaxID=2836217 RepID=UPI002FDE21BA|nr:cation diffusion facilitator family transporter [Bacteroidota bacterium]